MVGGALGFDMPAFDAPYDEPRILGEMCFMKGLTVVRVAQMMERFASAKLYWLGLIQNRGDMTYIQRRTGPPPQDWSTLPMDRINAISLMIDVKTVLYCY
jgi:hypothetical protein